MTLYQLLEIIDENDKVVIFSKDPHPTTKARGKNEAVFMQLVKEQSPLLNLRVLWLGHGEKLLAIQIPNIN